MATKNSDPDERSGTWGSQDAAAQWLRGAAARVEAFGAATERMLDLANIGVASRVLDVRDQVNVAHSVRPVSSPRRSRLHLLHWETVAMDVAL